MLHHVHRHANIDIDEDEFKDLFEVEKSLDIAPKVEDSLGSGKRGAVRVIDPKRANNGGIILARLKMSHDDMADAVDRINEQALTAEQIEHIIEYLPTKEERKALEAYMLEGGQDAAEKFDVLCECEKFMVSMMTVKHAKRKVRALLFKLQFQSCIEDIYTDTLTVEAACDELTNSVRLRRLLGIILEFGNRLNTAGNGKRKAGAFKLESLLKLNQAKAFDKKTTFLHFIILLVQRNNELLLNFKDDLPTVFKADKVYWDQCISDLEEVENQLENVRKIALYQARQAQAYRHRRKKREDDDESLSDGDVSLSLEEEVEALRATPVGLFTLSAIKYVSSLRDKVDDTRDKYARLLEYFGEDESMQPHALFNVIVAFSRDFDKAKEQVFSNEKRKQRENRKRQANEKTPNGKGYGRPPIHSPAQNDQGANHAMLKASNLQPSIGNIMKDMKRRPAAKDNSLDDQSANMSLERHQHQISLERESQLPAQTLSGSQPQQHVRMEHQPQVLSERFSQSQALDEVPVASPAPTGKADVNSMPSSPAKNAQSSSMLSSPARNTQTQHQVAVTPVRAALDTRQTPDVPTPSKSPSVTSSGQAALRRRAQMRRQRYTSERSASSPATMQTEHSADNVASTSLCSPPRTASLTTHSLHTPPRSEPQFSESVIAPVRREPASSNVSELSEQSSGVPVRASNVDSVTSTPSARAAMRQRHRMARYRGMRQDTSAQQ